MSSEAGREITRTKAAVRRSWWPGWIWAIPVAALLLLGWWTFRTFMNGGEDITIGFDDVHGLKSRNTSVLYRGMQVGSVSGIELTKSGDGVTVTVHIDDGATEFLRTGTKFWLRGAEPSLSDPSSLSAVLSGPTLVMEPGPGAKAKHFTGLVHEPVVSGAHEAPQIYDVELQGSVGGLKEGQPVKLRGFTVGEVKDVALRYDGKTGAVETSVKLALYPSLFHIDGAAPDDGTALAAAIDRLIRNGLSARLERDPPLVGGPEVTLEIVPGAGTAPPAIVSGAPQI
ncbi:MAG: MlaD family protein, partial [Gemmataceae bacterium]